jgi:hypothetical protein
MPAAVQEDLELDGEGRQVVGKVAALIGGGVDLLRGQRQGGRGKGQEEGKKRKADRGHGGLRKGREPNAATAMLFIFP